MKVKEESDKVGLKLSIQTTKFMASGPITSWQIDGETMETATNFMFLVSKITADGDSVQFSSVQSLSHVRLFATPWITTLQVSLSITNSQSLPKLMCIELVMPSNRLILCHHLLLLPWICPSIRAFSNKSVLIRRPKYWSFSFSISPSNEYSGLISFRMDWLDLLAGQRTLKSLLEHHSSKASILLHSAFFIVKMVKFCVQYHN